MNSPHSEKVGAFFRGSVLHVGCGGNPLPDWAHEYRETRVDIDPSHNPDIVADMRELGEIGQFHAIACNHALEHLEIDDAIKALVEFRRVLMPGGFAVVFVPDTEDIEANEDVLFVSPAGPITGLDLIHGMRSLLADNPYMAHKTCFTRETLENAFKKAGFGVVEVKRMEYHNLMCVAIK